MKHTKTLDKLPYRAAPLLAWLCCGLCAYHGSSSVMPSFAGPAKNTRFDRFRCILGLR